MNKDTLERMCRKAGLVPEAKRTMGDRDLFIADGFCMTPEIQFARMGCKPGEFPCGAYVTMWWTGKGEDRIEMAEPIFFDAFHDPGYDLPTKKQARINTAIGRAKEVMNARQAANGRN